MRLSPPKQLTWLIALLLGALGILANQISVTVLSDYDFWLVVAGFGLLILATLFRGL